MARRGGYKESYRGIGELLRSPMLMPELIRRAEKCKAYAEGVAPKSTGRYASSFYIRASLIGGNRNDRCIVFVGNDDPAAIAIEFGTKNTSAHRTLRRTAAEGTGD